MWFLICFRLAKTRFGTLVPGIGIGIGFLFDGYRSQFWVYQPRVLHLEMKNSDQGWEKGLNKIPQVCEPCVFHEISGDLISGRSEVRDVVGGHVSPSRPSEIQTYQDGDFKFSVYGLPVRVDLFLANLNQLLPLPHRGLPPPLQPCPGMAPTTPPELGWVMSITM